MMKALKTTASNGMTGDITLVPCDNHINIVKYFILNIIVIELINQLRIQYEQLGSQQVTIYTIYKVCILRCFSHLNIKKSALKKLIILGHLIAITQHSEVKNEKKYFEYFHEYTIDFK